MDIFRRFARIFCLHLQFFSLSFSTIQTYQYYIYISCFSHSSYIFCQSHVHNSSNNNTNNNNTIGLRDKIILCNVGYITFRPSSLLGPNISSKCRYVHVWPLARCNRQEYFDFQHHRCDNPKSRSDTNLLTTVV